MNCGIIDAKSIPTISAIRGRLHGTSTPVPNIKQCGETRNNILVHAKALWGEPARMHTCTQVKCMLGSEVDAIAGVGKCRRVGDYGRYCGYTSS